MEIIVTDAGGTAFAVPFETSISVGDVKKAIQVAHGIPCAEQRLVSSLAVEVLDAERIPAPEVADQAPQLTLIRVPTAAGLRKREWVDFLDARSDPLWAIQHISYDGPLSPLLLKAGSDHEAAALFLKSHTHPGVQRFTDVASGSYCIAELRVWQREHGGFVKEKDYDACSAFLRRLAAEGQEAVALWARALAHYDDEDAEGSWITLHELPREHFRFVASADASWAFLDAFVQDTTVDGVSAGPSGSPTMCLWQFVHSRGFREMVSRFVFAETKEAAIRMLRDSWPDLSLFLMGVHRLHESDDDCVSPPDRVWQVVWEFLRSKGLQCPALRPGQQLGSQEVLREALPSAGAWLQTAANGQVVLDAARVYGDPDMPALWRDVSDVELLGLIDLDGYCGPYGSRAPKLKCQKVMWQMVV